MSPAAFLGEFEQMVLLAILRRDVDAFALDVRAEIEERAGRPVSRGAFYTTLERLERKGYVAWSEAVPDGRRTTSPLRRYEVLPEGVEALRASRRAMKALAHGLGDVLEDA